jgi:hypothetical protein
MKTMLDLPRLSAAGYEIKADRADMKAAFVAMALIHRAFTSSATGVDCLPPLPRRDLNLSVTTPSTSQSATF